MSDRPEGSGGHFPPEQILTLGPNGEHVWKTASEPVIDYRPELKEIAAALKLIADALWRVSSHMPQ